MSGKGDDQGSHQHFNYDDGNRQMQYSSYTYSSQQGSEQPQPPPTAPQPQIQAPMPQLLQPMDIGAFHHQHMALHQQVHQQGMDLMQRQLNAVQPIMPMMHPHQPQQPQIQYIQSPAPQLQPQIQYIQASAPLLQSPPAPPLQIAPTPPGHVEDSEPDSDDEHKKNVARAFKQGNARLRKVEQEIARNRKRDEDKDRQLAEERARGQKLQQQMLENEQRHSSAIAELAQSQAPTPQPASQAFDMTMIKKFADELQSDRLTKADVKGLIEDAVQRQLSGVARTSDIESAASRMQKGLENMPAGASITQVQQTVRRELADAVQTAAKHMPSQQQQLEGPSMQPDISWARHAPQTHTALQQLPMDERRSQYASRKVPYKQSNVSAVSYATSTQQPRGNAHLDGAAVRASISKQRALEAPDPLPTGDMALTSQALAQLSTPVDVSSQKSRQSKSRVSVMPTADNALAPYKPSKSRSHRSSKMSSVSIQPSASNAMVLQSAGELQPYARETGILTELSLTDVPPSADKSGIASWADDVQLSRGKPSRSSKKSIVSIQPSASNAMDRPGAGDMPQYSSSAQAIVAQSRGDIRQYGGHQALPELPDDFPDTASQVPDWQQRQASRRAPSDEGAVARLTPRNDRRREIAGSPLRQLEGVSEEDEGAMALVKQSKDLSRKSRR